MEKECKKMINGSKISLENAQVLKLREIV